LEEARVFNFFAEQRTNLGEAAPLTPVTSCPVVVVVLAPVVVVVVVVVIVEAVIRVFISVSSLCCCVSCDCVQKRAALQWSPMKTLETSA